MAPVTEEEHMALADPGQVATVPTRHLFDLSIEFERVDVIGTPLGARMVAVVARGLVAGPELRGVVLPGGGDWLLVGPDGIARLDIRATIRTHNDALVYMTGLGRVRTTDDGRSRFLAGEPVRPPAMVGHTTPLFESSAPALVWLNATVALGTVTELALTHVAYRVDALDQGAPDPDKELLP